MSRTLSRGFWKPGLTPALALLLWAMPAAAAIRYDVSLANPEQHTFHVSMEVPNVIEELTVQMPAWNALYEIRDFSSHVQQVEAFANGNKAEIRKLDKLTWQVKATGTVTLRYSTFWDEPGPFSTQLNSEHAFINPALILLYVPERRTETTFVNISDVPYEWKAASSTLTDITVLGIGRSVFHLKALSYDALADAPVEVGKFEEFTLPDLTPEVRVVIHGDGWKKADVEAVLRKICAYELKLMDGPPYDRYTFLFHIGKAALNAGGGMEHANSTAINVPSDGFLPNVSAHEFFHLWNVKRIRPASLEPVDYTHEMYTRALWFAEGVTNTYGSYTLVRTGIWNRHDFYQDLSAQISEIESRPAEQWQSAEQSSLDAWLEKYPLYNQPQRSVSYYTKGQVLGVLLDILIRDRTGNQRSLDDVLRAMNADFAREGKLYQDSADIRRTSEKVAQAPLEEFFAKYVSGTAQLPYSDLLPLAGLELHSHDEVRPALGFSLQREANGPWAVAGLDAAGPAAASGLAAGDEILRWNAGEPPRHLERWLSQRKPGEELHLRVRHEDKEQNIVVRLAAVHQKIYQIAEAAHPDERAKHIREGLLHGTTDPVTARTQPEAGRQ